MPAVKSAKRITAPEPLPAELAELSTVELGKRHLNGTGVAATRAKAAKQSRGKIRTWPSGLDSWGTPTWICPRCPHVYRQSVCPAICKGCGEHGNPNQKLTDDLPEHIHNRGPVPADVRTPLHPASTSTTTPAGTAAYDPLAAPIARPVVMGTVDVDLRKILPSPDNPRKTFPKEELDELATSIEAKGLQQPLEILPADVHGLHELVDGERRFKALTLLHAKDKARWQQVPCVIKPLSRDEARDYRLTTFVRAGLNAIDQARAFQARLLADPPITQQQLGALVGMTQGAIANKIRLMKLPESVQQKIISGEMTEKQGREMLVYAELPGVLEEWAKSVKKKDVTGRDWKYELEDDIVAIADEMSRCVDANYVGFKITPELAKELDVRKAGHWEGAFNTKLYDKLQAEADKKKAARADRSEASAKEKEVQLTPAQIKERQQKQAAIFARKLYRYKIAWLQKRCVAVLGSSSHISQDLLLRLTLHFSVEDQLCRERGNDLAKAIESNGGKRKKQGGGYYSTLKAFESILTVPKEKLWTVCAHALSGMASHAFAETTRVPLQPVQIELLAGELGIDLKKEWQCDSDFLELHNGAQLQALAHEWKVIAIGEKRSEKIKSLKFESANRQLPCPKELLEAKAVRL
ncbi:MAG: ParB/RepB/Spo0J family partition protein [Patescibacteria group bacterium]|nr:ParB/RepB/Spo0J family partition protein [Patescibacteria group bacterium]